LSTSLLYVFVLLLRPQSERNGELRREEVRNPQLELTAPSSPLALPLSFLATVQGANRPDGVGFQSIKVLLENPATHIIATVRNPDAAVELKELGKDGRVDIVKAEVSSLESVKVSRLVS
jgi:hypothetical protein